MEFCKVVNLSPVFHPPMDNSDYLSMDYRNKRREEKDTEKANLRRHSTNLSITSSWRTEAHNKERKHNLNSETKGNQIGFKMAERREKEEETMISDTKDGHTLRRSLEKNSSNLSITRSWTIEPHNDQTEEAEERKVIDRQETGIWITQRPLSMVEGISSSLPTTIPTIVTTQTMQEDCPNIETIAELSGSSDCAGKPGSSLLTASSCVSLDCKATSQSPVSRFLPRLLRNSFSKIRDSIPSRSKSVDLLKSSSEVEDSEPDTTSSDIISPLDEEMVNESMKKGLPIIPFAYPSFVIVNKNVEDTKTLLRENSLKDLKHAFKTAKTNYEARDNASSEDRSGKQFTFSQMASSTSFNTAASSQSDDFSGPKSDYTMYTNQSSYVEMSPQENICVPRGNFGEDPYMVMGRQKENKEKRLKDFYDDTIFHLEQSHSSKEDKNNILGNSFSTPKYPFKTMSMFRRGEDKGVDDFDPLCPGDRRQYKKGNKHKGDYVFIDLGKNKDCLSMGKSGAWKSLSFYKKHLAKPGLGSALARSH